MNNELVMSTEIAIKHKKTQIKGKVMKVMMFAKSRILEVITETDDTMYLIYFGRALIYGGKLSKIKRGSHISKARRKGIIIDHTHPMLPILIPEQTITIPNKKKLFSTLKQQHSPQEMAYIATTLDSFFSKEDLIDIIEEHYGHYRQDGKFRKAFQIIQILTSFAPKLKSAHERMNSLDYRKYQDDYNTSNMASIQQRDPLFAEDYCFKHRSHSNRRHSLEKLLKEQGREIELVLLWLEVAKDKQQLEAIDEYTEIALRYVSLKQWMLILEEININPFKEMTGAKSIIDNMMQEANYETAALYLFDFIDDLPSNFNSILKELREHLDASFLVAHLDNALRFLKLPIDDTDHHYQVEQKLFQIAVKLLKDYDLKTVYAKLMPIKKTYPNSRVLDKLNNMLNLVENPDRMMELGQYYEEFKQFDDAIDCFFWEMELKPQDPQPVSKIVKMYQHKGMAKEAAAYQQVYMQLNNNQVTGA